MNWKRFSKVFAWNFFYRTNSNVRNRCVFVRGYKIYELIW